MNLNSVKCHIAGLAVLVAAAASAAVPARFCEYIESSTSGSTATYVDTGLKPHCANGKYFVDFEISAASLPGSVVYLFGYREKSGISNQMMDIALNASGTFRLVSRRISSSSSISLHSSWKSRMKRLWKAGSPPPNVMPPPVTLK